MPAVAVRSLIPIGTPRNGASPVVESMLAAVASASSPQTVTNAFSVESSRSIRSSESLDELGRRNLAAAHEPRLLEGREERDSYRNGEGRNRTGDTTVFSRVLYRLSYLAKAAQCSPADSDAVLGRRRPALPAERHT